MTQKRKTSVTRKQTEKDITHSQNSVLAKEILGIVIIALGLLAFVCVFFTSKSGTLKPFKEINCRIIGWTHYLIPFHFCFSLLIALAGE